MENIYEGLIQITKYDLAGNLPDPFMCNDGTRIKEPSQWEKRRKEIYASTVELQYGTMPPPPEFLEVEPLYIGGKGKPSCYRITSGTRAKPVTFTMTLIKAHASEKTPVVISGDLCFQYAFDKEYIDTFISNGISLALFNRTELAPDIAGYNLRGLKTTETEEYQAGAKILEGLEMHNCGGPLKEAYPEYTFGAVGAWAWGYSRCVDALEKLGNVDMDLIAFTGHSRGGKTAMLAGALDERAAIVNPNDACAGSTSCYRLVIEARTEDGDIQPSEPISNIFKVFPAWMGADLKEYIGREAELPFDSHYLKAMVAPRVLLVTEAASDIWANPVGSWQTSEAAKEVFKFLGCEENLIWHYRRGYHYQKIQDITCLVDVIRHVQTGAPLGDKFYKLPFKPMELAFDWRCPK